MHLPNCSPILQAIYTNSNSKAAAIRLENGCRNGEKIRILIIRHVPGLLTWTGASLNRPESDGWVLYRA